MFLKTKLLWLIVPFYVLAVVDELLYTEAYMNSVRIEEIPFALTMHHSRNRSQSALRRPSEESRNIYALKRVDQHKGFLKIFNIPYIICFFAAKGKWPFIPPFMQTQVNAAARTFFNQNDSSIKQFCQKWIQIKECFRPIFSPTTTPVNLEVITVSPQRCQCANLVSTEAPVPVVYFDRDHIGNISAETIRNTIEFLENFLPPPTKKNKRKNRVRSRLDEMDIE
ncbi:uncharacterized protein LOC101898187 [Musca domestica]|uniref:Uncharacterized protein LOC101898187 n=1 Tax=Musca domestica TaxID=7370 RepID=A0A1I8NF99_MUSDO|nr:uncharacterized protein LOC101898187 [Musca domestica]